MNTQEEQIIHDFVKKVEEKLPTWLKEKRGELKSVLAELEEHIWDKATELGKGNPDAGTVQAAIAEMGTPSAIAREYKRRGTPKVFITEELWPSYTRTLLAVILVVVSINLVSFFIEGFATASWVQALENFDGIYSGVLLAFVIVSLVFVGLSMQGWLPEDFKSKFLRGRKANASLSPSSTPEKPVKFVRVAGEFVGGVVNIIFGGVLIMLRSILANIPIEGFAKALADYEEFFIYLIPLGIILIINGGTQLVRSLLGNDPRTGHLHRTFRIVNAIATFAAISFLTIMLIHPEMVPLFIINIGETTTFSMGIPPEFYPVCQQVFGVIIALTALGGSIEVYKAVTLKP